jgi:hypothetical protein
MIDSDQLIRERAYHLWLQDGCPEGQADFHWHVAREQVLATLRQPTAKSATKRAPAAQRVSHLRTAAKIEKTAARAHAPA